MRRVVLVVAALALLVPGGALAHPLGNFTVNRYAGIELSGNRVYVHYALDLAEIPAFQEGKRFRRPGTAARLARALRLSVDGRRRPLRVLDSRLESRPGAGGLETLRFDAVYDAGPGGQRLAFHDENFARRLGWKEVVVRGERGARLVSSTAPSRSASNALRSYPKDLLQEPLHVTSAKVTFRPGSLPGIPPGLGSASAADHGRGGFESLIAREDVGPGLILLSLVLALFWGAVHALTPGHGKAIVAGYLVGTRGRPRDAVALGLIVTATHTIGVFALGLVTLALSAFVVPERLYPWLTLVSGLLVVGVGASVLYQRLRHRRQHAHGHHHHHDHEHGYGRGGLLGVGVAAGLLPCPSALVVLLSAIALHRVGLGLALIVAFSVGLAATITAVGLVAVLAKRAFSRLRLDGRLIAALPAASALAIVAVGIGITLNALPEVV